MTVYARSDLVCVALSAEHGGCGATHTRPVTHGAPAKVWALDCPPCEDHLRHDPGWATNSMEIPETPDEIRLREEGEKRGERVREQNLETAIASLAATADGFGKLMTMMFAGNPELAQNMSKMLGQMAANETPDTSVQDDSIGFREADGLTVLKSAAQQVDVPDPTKLKLAQLRDVARQRGLDASGTRDDLIARLQG